VKTEICVCAQLLYFRFEIRSAIAKSDFSYVDTHFFPDFAMVMKKKKKETKVGTNIDFGLFYILI